MKVDSDVVRWADRLFLDREAENDRVVEEKVGAYPSVAALRRAFLQSAEFLAKNDVTQLPRLAGSSPAMAIEHVPEGPQLERLFAHIQETWKHLGETEPYWSVLSHESFLAGNLGGDRVEHFYATGEPELRRVFGHLRRVGVDPTRLRTCLEYGCGLGRVTRWLAGAFERVHGYDVSVSHLALAEAALRGYGVGNVELHAVRSPADLDALARVDFIYSVIVLQHNPPPLIAWIIERLLRAVNPGGVAMFQVPTYRHGYRFDLASYLSAEATRQEIEMHVLPQAEVFRLVTETGTRVLDVLDDGHAGTAFRGLSNTFVVQRP